MSWTGTHHPRRLRLWGPGYFRRVGPGVITGAADDDPSGIGTYSQVGAAYGTQLLWTAPTLLPLAFAVQEACARLALVTGKGLAALVKERLPRPVLVLALVAVTVAGCFNIAADLASMAAAVALLVPVPQAVGVLVFTVGITAAEVLVPYHRYTKVLRWLCVSLFAYVGVLAFAHVSWSDVARSTLLPSMSLTRATVVALIALAGTTISPYLFFWQAAEETEEEHGVPDVSVGHLRAMRGDVLVGMTTAVVIMFSIMVTAASTLHVSGVTDVATAEEAAAALEPLAGRFAGVLFLLGIVGTGLLAVPVLAGASAYALADAFGWQEGLERRPGQARAFYGVIVVSMGVALLLNYLELEPMRFLYWAAVLNGLAAPPLLLMVWWLARDRRLMGEHASGRWSQAGLLAAALVMAGLPVLWLLLG